MKTTVNIADELFHRARKLAAQRDQTMRSLIEDGLRRVLADSGPPPYCLEDCAVGDPTAADPLNGWSWQDLRDEIYGNDG